MFITERPDSSERGGQHRSSANDLFGDAHAGLLERVRQDLRPQPNGDFDSLRDILLDSETDWLEPATASAGAILGKLATGDRLYVALSGDTARATFYNRASEQLLKQYALHRIADRYELEIPGRQISELRPRSFVDVDRGGNRRAVVDLQIKTGLDEPVHVFTRDRQPDGSQLRAIESGGQWFSFPLDVVKLDLMS